MMRKLPYLLVLIVLSGLAGPRAARAESVTLSSYYPVPAGSYDRLRLVPRSEITGACDPGLLYYWTNNGIRVCNDAGAYVPLSPWSQSGDNIFPTDTTANPDLKIGLGTQSPPFRFSLDTGAATPDGGIWAEGTYNTGAAVGNPGAGTRLLWYPAKAAFRAGNVSADQWNENNIGLYSVALGSSNIASGAYSTALGSGSDATGTFSLATGYATTASGYGTTSMGFETTASGWYSTAMGHQTSVSGYYGTAMGRGTSAQGESSTAMGYQTTAGGFYSTAMGHQTTAGGHYSTAMGSATNAQGNYSTAMGIQTTAQPYAATVLGRYNLVSGNATSWVATDPLFVVGNGASAGSRSNAVTVLKNGNTGIMNASPSTALDVNGIIRALPEAKPECNAQTEGGIYYDKDDKIFYGCDGSDWVQLNS